MLRWVILSVAVVALAAAATVVVHFGTGSSPSWDLPSGGKKTGPQPRVEIEGPLVHEFGEMSTQKVATRKWKIKNTGQGDLDIWLTGSTCTCTIPKLRGKTGEEGRGNPARRIDRDRARMEDQGRSRRVCQGSDDRHQ